jgi:hypothetical protein
MEAMPEGGVLSVSTEFYRDAGNCRIRIRDTGTGIAPETVEHIFEPFFTTKEFRHSTGLGLPIAKGIVERHGGALEVESQTGKGTEFRFSLPMFPLLPEPQRASQAETAMSDTHPLKQNLIVDDDAVVLTVANGLSEVPVETCQASTRSRCWKPMVGTSCWWTLRCPGSTAWICNGASTPLM